MMTNTTDKTEQASMLLKIAAGLFLVTAILDSIAFFNYSSTFGLVDFIVNIISIIFLAIVIFVIKELAGSGNHAGISRFNYAGGVLIVYAILWLAYYFTPSIGVFGDLGFFITVLIARGIAFSLVFSAFKALNRGMGNVVLPLYGFSQILFFGITFFLFFMWLDNLAYTVVDIGYWVDILLMAGIAIVLFLDSNKVSSAPKIISQPYKPYAPTYSQPSNSNIQIQVQQSIQPIQSEVPPQASSFCINCGSGLDPGEKFCTNCGAKVE